MNNEMASEELDLDVLEVTFNSFLIIENDLEETFNSCLRIENDPIEEMGPSTSDRAHVYPLNNLNQVFSSEIEKVTNKEIDGCESSSDNCSVQFSNGQNLDVNIRSGKNKAKIIRDKLKELRLEQYSFMRADLDQVTWHRKEVFQFKVLSYNVLSQHLLVSNRHLYKDHNPVHLDWNYRAPLLMTELKNINADIICLQEVEDGHKAFYDGLEKYGYQGIFKKRTGDKNDGCAIYFKNAIFSLLDHATVEFHQPGIPVLNRDNVGLVLKLLPIGWIHQPLVVATTHILYNPCRHDVKLAQMQVFLAEIERFAFNSNVSSSMYHPVILTGDFNVEPYSSIYDFLLNGCLRYDILGRKTLTMNGSSPRVGKRLIPLHLGITDSCQHFPVLEFRDSGLGAALKDDEIIGLENSDKDYPPRWQTYVPDEDQCRFESGVLSHVFEFESAYSHDNDETGDCEATTYHDKWLTVDYIFYTPLRSRKDRHRCQLQLISNVRLPTASECESYIKKIPNEVCPSDHLPLIATFCLRDKPDL